MTPQERDVLQPLLDRLRQTRLATKDAEADQLIRQTVQAQPDAPYVLAQTVLMQDYALHAAQDRIHALEQQLAQLQSQSQQQQGQHTSGGGFLSGLLGGSRPTPAPAPPPPPAYGPAYGQGAPAYAQPSYGSQIANAVQPSGGGSSFLRSAAQTAAGVAGGALLVQGLEGLFGGHGGGMFGGGSGLMGGGASGFLGDAGNSTAGSMDRFADGGGANDLPPLPDDQLGGQGGDTGTYADQGGYADTGGDAGGNDFSSGDLGSGDLGGNDLGGNDLGGGDYGGSDIGTDDSFNS